MRITFTTNLVKIKDNNISLPNNTESLLASNITHAFSNNNYSINNILVNYLYKKVFCSSSSDNNRTNINTKEDTKFYT